MLLTKCSKSFLHLWTKCFNVLVAFFHFVVFQFNWIIFFQYEVWTCLEEVYSWRMCLSFKSIKNKLGWDFEDDICDNLTHASGSQLGCHVTLGGLWLYEVGYVGAVCSLFHSKFRQTEQECPIWRKVFFNHDFLSGGLSS